MLKNSAFANKLRRCAAVTSCLICSYRDSGCAGPDAMMLEAARRLDMDTYAELDRANAKLDRIREYINGGGNG